MGQVDAQKHQLTSMGKYEVRSNVLSRRSFLQNAMALPWIFSPLFPGPSKHMLSSINQPKIKSISKPEVTVIGAGAFGGWIALHLLRNGVKITLFDAWGPGNSRASSGGDTRVIRGAYSG